MAGKVWRFFTILNFGSRVLRGNAPQAATTVTGPQSAGGLLTRETNVHPLSLGVRNLRYKLSYLAEADAPSWSLSIADNDCRLASRAVLNVQLF